MVTKRMMKIPLELFENLLTGMRQSVLGEMRVLLKSDASRVVKIKRINNKVIEFVTLLFKSRGIA